MKAVLSKSLIVIFFLSGFSLLLGAEWYVSYEKALDAIQKKQWQAAVEQLNAALREKSGEKENAKTYGLRFIDYFPYLYRGLAYYHLGDYDRASADLQKSESFGEVGKASRDKEAPQKLKKYLDLVNQQKQLAETKKQVESAFSAGVEFFNQQKFQAARSKFEAVLKLDAQHSEAKSYLKKIEDELSRMQMAAEEKKRQEQISKTFAEGVAFFEQKDFEKAKESFDKVLNLDRSHSEASHYLDLIEAEKERLTQIDREFKEGVTFYKKEKFDQAKQKFRNVLTIDRAHQEAKDYLDKIVAKQAALAKADEPEKSQTVAEAANHLDKSFQEGAALFEEGHLAEARQKFSELTEDNPHYPDAKQYLEQITQIEKNVREGVVAFFEGSNEKSIEYLVQATQVYHSNAQIYAVLGCAYAAEYFLHGEKNDKLYENAMQCFRESKKIDSAYQLDKKFFSPRIVDLFEKM